MSVYVLRAFAPHLTIVKRSCLEVFEPQFGVLAMAVTAVGLLSHHGCLSNPVFPRLKLPSIVLSLLAYKPPIGNLDKVGGAGLCDKWLLQGITNLYNKQAWWDEVMHTAKAQACTHVGSKHGHTIMLGAQHDHNVVPDSSSPIRSE